MLNNSIKHFSSTSEICVQFPYMNSNSNDNNQLSIVMKSYDSNNAHDLYTNTGTSDGLNTVVKINIQDLVEYHIVSPNIPPPLSGMDDNVNGTIITPPMELVFCMKEFRSLLQLCEQCNNSNIINTTNTTNNTQGSIYTYTNTQYTTCTSTTVCIQYIDTGLPIRVIYSMECGTTVLFTVTMILATLHHRPNVVETIANADQNRIVELNGSSNQVNNNSNQQTVNYSNSNMGGNINNDMNNNHPIPGENSATSPIPGDTGLPTHHTESIPEQLSLLTNKRSYSRFRALLQGDTESENDEQLE